MGLVTPCRHSSLLRPHQTLLCKVKALHQQYPEMPQTCLRGTDAKWKVCCGLTSWHFGLLLEIMDIVSSTRTIQIVTGAKLGSQHLCWCGVDSFCEGTIHAERNIQVMEQHKLPSRQGLFQRRSCLCDEPSHILHVLQQRGYVVKWVRLLNWPACSPDLLPLKMCGALWSVKYDNGDLRLWAQE